MAFESSTPFAEIKDFREAEINGIPALYTICRIDADTLPEGIYACEISGGRGTDFLWIVPQALVNFTGTIISRQPLLRGRKTFMEIRNYGIHSSMDFEEWLDNNNLKSKLCNENSK